MENNDVTVGRPVNGFDRIDVFGQVGDGEEMDVVTSLDEKGLVGRVNGWALDDVGFEVSVG